ncbi:amidase [Saccharopolyspora sp. 5N708]|uniref:amidase n=1 Tax=Saccharopolyspora sp. 5N708 TaxID=3457424 RepID=UPI003FD2A785
MQPHEFTVSEAAERIRSGELSPVELTEDVLARIAATEPVLNAYVQVTAERAVQQARRAADEIIAGDYRGPLHGIPVALKDLFDVAGLPTTASSAVRADYVPGTDSAVAERLTAAGAVTVGKTHTHEFAFGAITPTTRNPWDTTRSPGGSSGGSGAAVAAGSALAAMGSDTGGSIRIPAALCGTVGLKPTYGRVSRFGVTSLSWSLDHVGPLTRTARDAAVLLGALAGYDRRDPATVDVEVPDYLAALAAGTRLAGLRIGVPTNYFFDQLHPEVEKYVVAAISVLQDLGAEVREVRVPHAETMREMNLLIVTAEAASYHQAMLRDKRELYQPDVLARINAGRSVSALDYLSAIRHRSVLQAAWRDLYADVDVIVAPTVAIPAPRTDQPVAETTPGAAEPVTDALTRLCAPANATGLPAVSVPCGLTEENLPVAFQVIGRPFAEGTILRVANAYESVEKPAKTPTGAALGANALARSG